MKILTRLSLSLVTMVVMWGGPFQSVWAEEESTSADSEMQDALDQLDALLESTGADEDVSDDLLSQLNRLQSQFQRLQKELEQDQQDDGKTDALSEAQARLKNLQDENEILKAEVDKQYRRVEKAEKARKQAEADFERLFKGEENAAIPPAASADQAAEIERLTAELATAKEALAAARASAEQAVAPVSDDQRVRDLQAAVEELKEVDAQRKSAMDDLFKQLGSQKKEGKAQEQRITELESALAAEQARVTERDNEIAARDETIAAKQSALEASQQQINDLQSELSDVRNQKQSTASTLASREDRIAALEAELEQIRLVDAQRRKTLDETLESLATTEKKAKTLTAELEQERSAHASLRKETENKISDLTARNELLESEITRMEKDVSTAMADRDAALAQVSDLRKTLSERDTTVTGLENQVARLSAVDKQRRKAMDQILLETAELEQEKTRLERDVQRLKQVEANSSQADAGADDQVANLKAENAQLQTRVAELEQLLQQPRDTGKRVADSSADAETPAIAVPAVDPPADPAKRQQLEAEVAEWREAAAADAERIESLTRDLTQAQQDAFELETRVNELESRKADVRQSDLFKDLEQVNAMLREKMLEVEADRQRLAKRAEEADATDALQTRTIEEQAERLSTLETSLDEALAREEEYKELIERLVPEVAELEQQVTSLTQERVELTNRLLQRDEDIQALKSELERREHRLAKAERVADVLEQARTEVLRAGEREKLNMHYNMASVYAREGKFKDAENEYLQALKIDPTDSDVHYNLGILYEDEMKQPEKAMVHYRRYLQLSPHGPDADRVRTWLMKLEMQAER